MPLVDPIVIEVQPSPWEGIAVAIALLAVLISALSFGMDALSRRIAAARLCYSSVTRTKTYAAGDVIQESGLFFMGNDYVRVDLATGRSIAVVPILVWQVEVFNGSDEPITLDKIEIRQQGVGRVLGSAVEGEIAPRSSITQPGYWALEHPDVTPIVSSALYFRDGAGRAWFRLSFDPVRPRIARRRKIESMQLRKIGGGLLWAEPATPRPKKRRGSR